MSDGITIKLPSAGGLGPSYPSSVVMVFPSKPFRRKRKIRSIFEIEIVK